MVDKPLIEQLFDIGGYHIKSQYRVMFPKGIPGILPVVTSMSDVFPTIPSLTLRQNGSVDIPQREYGTFERHFQGLKIVMSSASENTSKQFNLQFAIDENFEIWSALNQLYRRSFDDLNGIVGCEADTRFPIVIEFVGFNRIGDPSSFSFKKPPRYAIIFQGCKLTGLKMDSVDHGASEPLMADATFIYFYQIEYINRNETCSTDLTNGKYPSTTLPELPNYPDYKLDHPYSGLFTP